MYNIYLGSSAEVRVVLLKHMNFKLLFGAASCHLYMERPLADELHFHYPLQGFGCTISEGSSFDHVQMIYLSHLMSLPPCAPSAVTLGYCCFAGWLPIVLRRGCSWQLRSEESADMLPLSLLRSLVIGWKGNKRISHTTQQCKRSVCCDRSKSSIDLYFGLLRCYTK